MDYDATAFALAEDPEDDAAERYAEALETAEKLDAWDAKRRVDIALEATAGGVVIATHDRQMITDLSHWHQLTLGGVGESTGSLPCFDPGVARLSKA